MDHIGPLVCPVLVARDDLLELASRRLAAAIGGTGHLLLLAGEAGVGKTRLLASVERRAAALGYRVSRGAAFPRDLQVAAAPLIDLARAMARDPATADTGHALEARLVEVAEDTDGDAHRRRRVLVLDVVDQLVAAAKDGPTLLSLEDLHWADDLSLEVLAGLARRLPDVPLVVVGTYRSDELYPRIPMREWRARLLTSRLAEEARLARLDPDGTATMIDLLLELDLPPARDLVTAIHARTDGIPLHVEELLGAMLAGGQRRPEIASVLVVPDTLDSAVIERLSLRSDEAREVAEAGAVIGRSFEPDLLAQVVETDARRLDRALAELADHFFLVPGSARTRYDFRHALIRDAIYGRIPLPRRRRLHGRVADAAAAAGAGSAGFLSAHYEEAGRHEEAFHAALDAAAEATSINSHHEARDLYRRALRNLPASLPTGEHARILEATGAGDAAVDDNAAAVEAFEEAARRYREAGRVLEAAAVVAPLVAARHLLGAGLDERAARLTEALAEVEALPRSPEADAVRGRLLAGLAAAHMLDRRLDASLEHGEPARRLAAAAGDEATECNAMATVGSVQVFAGRMDEGWALLEEAVRRGRDRHAEAEAARTFRMLGSSASVLVEYDRAESWLRDGIEYAERVELWNHRHYMAAHLAHVRWASGDWDGAHRLAAQALADGRGGITTRVTALHVLGYLALGRGELARAREVLAEARETGERMAELQRLSPALWGLAEVELLAGNAWAAADLCEQGRAASAAVEDAAYLFPFLVTGTRAFLTAGDLRSAERWVDDVAASLRHRSIPGTLPAIDHAAGLLALAQGSTGRARTLLERAGDGWAARRRAWEGTAGLTDLAACHLRANRPADAVRLATTAGDAAGRIGSPPLAARADDVLRAARARHPDDAPWAPLTAREWEVARLIAGGMTNAAIAAELGVSPRTVGSHVEHILGRLGASRRAEIAAWVATIGHGHG